MCILFFVISFIQEIRIYNNKKCIKTEEKEKQELDVINKERENKFLLYNNYMMCLKITINKICILYIITKHQKLINYNKS